MPQSISIGDSQYAFDIVKTIYSEAGPGLPGTSQERARVAIIHKELESHLGPGNAAIEEFTLAPDAFLTLYPVLFMIAAALLNILLGQIAGISPWLTAIVALTFSILSPLLFILEFFLGYEVIDPLLPKKHSFNVMSLVIRNFLTI